MKQLSRFLGILIIGFSSIAFTAMYDHSFSTSWCITCTDDASPNWGSCVGLRGERYSTSSGFVCDGTMVYECGGGGSGTGPAEQ